MDHSTKKYYSLTHAQKRIWYSEKIFKGFGYENICFVVSFTEPLSELMLEKAINLLIEKNDGMRIRIVETEDGECKQYFSNYKYIKFDTVKFTGDNAEEDVEKFFNDQASTPLNINDSELYYFAIVNVNQDVRIFMKTHHIISDGWAVSMMVNQIVEYCKGISAGNEYIADNQSSYLNYILWEKQYIESEKFREHAKFWHERFSTIPEELSIEPYKKWDKEDFNSDRKVYTLTAELTSEIQNFCKLNHTSVFKIFLASLFIYIYRVTLREDISIASPIYNRFEEWQKDIIGVFVSTSVFRLNIKGEYSFQCLLDLLRDELKSVLTNQSYPYDQLVYELRNKHHSKNEISLYDILFSYQNALYCREVKDANWHFCGQVPNSIAFHISDRGLKGCLKFEIDYRTSLFTPSDIDRIYKCLINIIKDGMSKPTKKLSLLELQDDDEKRKLLFDFNDTYRDFPENKTIHQLFEEQVYIRPDSIAAVCKDRVITYAELNLNANRLANRLRMLGVKPNESVGLMVDRSIDMLVGIMAILKAGGGYLPIDPQYPLDRVKFMFEDSDAHMLITKRSINRDLNFNGEVVYVEDSEEYKDMECSLDNVNRPEDLAYIIYTSGSTGKPKGVMVEHRAVTNFITGMKDKIDFNSKKTILAVTTICFDIFVLENILPLTVGMKIIIADENQQLDPSELNNLIIDKKVDMLQTTPSRMELILSNEIGRRSISNVKEIMVGGEPITNKLLNSLKAATSAKIYNMYGPTETTVWSTLNELTNTDTITIGCPIANTQIYIVNNDLQLLPIGVVGELCIAGNGLARCYHKRPELTAEKFVHYSFENGKTNESDFQLMYRTGDLARWLPNGEIEFIGRKDTQVKIRGYRIELEEVEKVLAEHEKVSRCAVLVKNSAEGNKNLVAYYVSNEEIPYRELYSFLLQKLPHYMVPGSFIHIAMLPLTPNGKLDKTKLPDPCSYLCSENKKNILPETKLQKNIADIWSKVLNKNIMGVNDNFFEIGGNSFSLVIMHSKIDKLYPGKVSVADVFANPTIAKLSDYISGQLINENKDIKIPLIKLPEKYFSNMNVNTSADTLVINLDNELCDKVLILCKKYNIELPEFALAIYLYLLLEAAECNTVCAHVLSSCKDEARQVNADLDKVSSMEDFFLQVKREYNSSSRDSTYELKKIMTVGVQKEKLEILPVFIDNIQLNRQLTEVYDIVLKLDNDMSNIIFYFDFNSQRIEEKARRALVSGFLELVKNVVDDN